MAKVILFGRGNMADQVHFYLTHDSPHDVVAFTVDAAYVGEDTFRGLPVVAFENLTTEFPPDDYQMLVPISYRGVNRLRAEKYRQAKAMGYRFIDYISSKAFLWPDLTVGENTLIFEAATVQPHAVLGNNVLMAPGSLVSHHCVVEDHVFIADHAVVLGSARINAYAFLGANCTIRDDVTIARECVISAGTFIGKDTQERGVYLGSRATLHPRPSNEWGW